MAVKQWAMREVVVYFLNVDKDRWHSIVMKMSWYYRADHLPPHECVKAFGKTMPKIADWRRVCAHVRRERGLLNRFVAREEKLEATERKRIYMRKYMRTYRKDGKLKRMDREP